jgi:transposase-like protein
MPQFTGEYSKEFQLQAAKLVTEQGYSYDKAAKRLTVTIFEYLTEVLFGTMIAR